VWHSWNLERFSGLRAGFVLHRILLHHHRIEADPFLSPRHRAEASFVRSFLLQVKSPRHAAEASCSLRTVTGSSFVGYLGVASSFVRLSPTACSRSLLRIVACGLLRSSHPCSLRCCHGLLLVLESAWSRSLLKPFGMRPKASSLPIFDSSRLAEFFGCRLGCRKATS